MLKQVAIAIAVVLVVVLLVLGPVKLITHLRAVRDVANQTVDEISPDVQEAARVRVLLRDLDKQLLNYQEQIASAGEKADAAEERVTRNRNEIEDNRNILKRARGLIDGGPGPYDINNKSYTRDEVCADALARVRHVEALTSQLKVNEKMAEKLRAAEREGTTNLAKARALRDQKASELNTLEARLRNARLLAQVNDLTRGLRETPLGPSTELGKAFEAFRRRCRAAERQADHLATEARGGMVVDWAGGPDHTENVSAAIDRVLRAGPAAPDQAQPPNIPQLGPVAR